VNKEAIHSEGMPYGVRTPLIVWCQAKTAPVI